MQILWHERSNASSKGVFFVFSRPPVWKIDRARKSGEWRGKLVGKMNHGIRFFPLCLEIELALRNKLFQKRTSIEWLNDLSSYIYFFFSSLLCFIKTYVHLQELKNLEATIVFVYFTKAFDSIHRGKMEQTLLAYGLPKETFVAIMMLYRNTKVKVRSPDGDTDYFDIVAGVLQGDTLSPYLYYRFRLRA